MTARLIVLLSTLKIMWADTGYNGTPLRDWMTSTAGITLQIVAPTSPHAFQVLKRRWVVERTFGWLMRYRRLARDYERCPGSSEAMIYWATIFIMTKRLTRYETGQPTPKRWPGNAPAPHHKLLYQQALKNVQRRGTGRNSGTAPPEISPGTAGRLHSLSKPRADDARTPASGGAAPPEAANSHEHITYSRAGRPAAGLQRAGPFL